MKTILMLGLGGVGLAAVGGGGAYVTLHAKPKDVPLLGDDMSQMRREALAMFPPGEKAETVVVALKALGFHCSPARRLVPNINAPFVQCDSAGRNYPFGSRYEITVMTRNGVVADLGIGNGLDGFEASARTPNPTAGGQVGKEAEPTG